MRGLTKVFAAVAGLAVVGATVLFVGGFIASYFNDENRGSRLDEGIEPYRPDPHYQAPQGGMSINTGTTVARAALPGLMAELYIKDVYKPTIDNFITGRQTSIPLTSKNRNHIVFTPQKNGATRETVDAIANLIQGKQELTPALKDAIFAELDKSTTITPTVRDELKTYMNGFGTAPVAQLQQIDAARAKWAPLLQEAIAAFEATDINLQSALDGGVRTMIADVNHHFTGSHQNLFLDKTGVKKGLLFDLIKERSDTRDNFNGFTEDDVTRLARDKETQLVILDKFDYMRSYAEPTGDAQMEAFINDPANARFMMTPERAAEMAADWGLDDPVMLQMLGNPTLNLANKKTIIHALTETTFVPMGFSSYFANRVRLENDIRSRVIIQGALEAPRAERQHAAALIPLNFG